MNTTRIPRQWIRLLALAGLAPCLVSPALSQTILPIGGTEANFTLVNHLTGAPIHLSDFAGKIVVLDYYAYWCGWCAIDSPLTETDIQQYYAARGGNAAGIPVQVLSVSIDQADPAATTAFIGGAGVELAGDDILSQAWNQNATDGIPTYEIINGVANAPGMKQWQLLYTYIGYDGPTLFRQAIDSVAPPQTGSPLAITAQPLSQTVTSGSGVVLAASGSSNSTVSYQWSLNGTPISGANGPALLLNNVQAANGGLYTVLVSDNQGNSAVSIAAELAVAQPVGTAIAVFPATQVVSAGGSGGFAVTAGPAGTTYQWQFNGVNLTDGGAVSGSSGPQLVITGANSGNTGEYSCLVTSGGVATQSDSAALVVPTSFAVLPATETVAVGATSVLAVAAPAGSTYQWQFNGVNLTDGGAISGSSGPQLVITGAGAGNSGVYSCLVTAGGIAAQSGSANLAVTTTSNPGFLVNISSRAYVGTGPGILIGGFYIGGSTSRTVLIQALGPALSDEGVTGILQRPALTIYNTSGAVITSNTGWGSGQLLLKAAAAAYATPALKPDSGDSEILITLPPGGYTAQVAGADGGTGVALCAIYQLP